MSGRMRSALQALLLAGPLCLAMAGLRAPDLRAEIAAETRWADPAHVNAHSVQQRFPRVPFHRNLVSLTHEADQTPLRFAKLLVPERPRLRSPRGIVDDALPVFPEVAFSVGLRPHVAYVRPLYFDPRFASAAPPLVDLAPSRQSLPTNPPADPGLVHLPS